MRKTPLLGLVIVALAGCDQLFNIIRLTRTTVILRNDGAFPVDVELFTSSEQDIPEALLTADSDDADQFNVPAGQQTVFSMDCDDLQAIIISDADLEVVGQVGPEADTGVLRDGDDFGCGDTIIFTFDHSDILIDFDITVEVQPGGLGD